MKFFGFRGGVHPPENKIQTEHLPIEKLESPDEIFVPLLQHIGAPLNPLVNCRGEEWKAALRQHA